MLWNSFLLAIREIRRNITRAILTVLGVVIGVSAVITLVTLGNGASATITDQISGLGSNLLVLSPGQRKSPGSSRAGVPNFTEADATVIKEVVPGLAAVAPVSSTAATTIYLQNSRTTGITGTTIDHFSIGNWTLADGRYFNEIEARSGAAVCVIGETVRKELFGSDAAVGERIRLNTTSMQVIGVLKSKGQSFGRDQDDTIVIPITTLQRRLVGRNSLNNVNQIMISAKEGWSTTTITDDITSLMRERRNVSTNEEADFSVMDTQQIAEAVSSSTKVMTTLLGAIAGVSLLVGGIGIMNIMLVSVTERTREIGIRLAIGARAREVLLQFLVEAITLSAVGGLIGIALATGFCAILTKAIDVPFVFDLKINVTAFLFSAFIGVLFGFMPARRAASLNPIDALRHE